MKLTKGKIHKLLLKDKDKYKQTKKHYKKPISNKNNYCNTFKNRKSFNLKNKTLKDLY